MKKKLYLFFIFVFTFSFPLYAEYPSLEETIAQEKEKLENSVVLFPKIEFINTRYNFGSAYQGEPVKYQFEFYNKGNGDLFILGLKSTCGCTVASASKGPYKPGEKGFIEVTYDTRGKFGFANKQVSIETNDVNSPHTLVIEGNVDIKDGHPPMVPGMVLFQGSCAECHSVPAKGKAGKELYDAVCHMCHDFPQEHGKKWVAPNKFSLAQNSKRRLKKIISNGEAYTSMPGFLLENGGPLTEPQIDSLVEYIYSLRQTIKEER